MRCVSDPGRIIAIFLALSACATAPRQAPVSAPAPTLFLCPKVFVANAPPSGADRRVLSYSPYVAFRGIALRRAPVDGCLSSAFGVRVGGAGIVHDGLDLYTGEQRSVAAGGDGRVSFIREQNGYGLTLAIDHGGGVETRYAHLSSIAPRLRPGSYVGNGEIIARTGRSGNATAVHLHYEIRLDGAPQDPLRSDA